MKFWLHCAQCLWAAWDHIGSTASILSLAVSLWVLKKERSIEKDVTALKTEEEGWHKEGAPKK